MAVQFNEYTIGAIDIDGTIIKGTDNYNENPTPTVTGYIAAGKQSPSRQQTHVATPSFSFTSTEVELLLNDCALFASANNLGVEIGTSMTIYWTKKNALKHSTGADHLTTTITEGIIYPTQLSWSDGFWELSVTVIPYSETGATNPFVYGTASAPTYSAIEETYQGGKVTVSGVEVNCWQSVTLDFGITAAAKFHKGLPYPTRAEIATIEPFFTLQNLDPAVRSTFGMYGSIINDFELFLRASEYAFGNVPTVVADGTASHIRFDGIGGIVFPEATSGSSRNSATQDIRIQFNETSAHAVLIPNFGVAIT